MIRDVMKYELETKKKHLLKLREYFRTDIEDTNSPKYEDNAINALLEMKKVKTEIEQLEYYLQLKTWFFGRYYETKKNFGSRGYDIGYGWYCVWKKTLRKEIAKYRMKSIMCDARLYGKNELAEKIDRQISENCSAEWNSINPPAELGE